MICEKCRYCCEVDQSNEENGSDIIQYCKYGLGDAYNKGGCNYPFIFIPIINLRNQILRFFYAKKDTENYKLFESIIKEVEE